jgi:hypothetical protein
MCLREIVWDKVSVVHLSRNSRQWRYSAAADDKSVSITPRNFLTVRDFVTLEDGNDRLYRNVGNNLPIYAS